MIQKRILHFLDKTPTDEQLILSEKLAAFVANKSRTDIFVLRGYAGTGKTTMISSLVKAMKSMKLDNVLLAPTGRAAKVFAAYSANFASTIHRKIYRLKADKNGFLQLIKLKNSHVNTAFIVDEASMIGEEMQGKDSLFGSHSVLDDLIEYVFSGENCRLILVGDTAQLPPVGLDISPALNPDYLGTRYLVNIEAFSLTEVLRQEKESGILYNATLIRSHIAMPENHTNFRFELSDFKDVIPLQGESVKDAIEQAYNDYGIENTLVVCRSNKRANLYNQQIRNRIFFREEEITTGDLLMVVKNNYFWLPESSLAGFIANGDIIEIVRMRKTYELYGFRFADVTVSMVDYPQEPELDTILLLDALNVESASLPYEKSRKLYEEVAKDYEYIRKKTDRLKAIREDKHLNAIQVKFAYAVTCHKAQGGQWQGVFIDHGYLTPEMKGREFMRWLYTAVTRSYAKVFLINFNKEFLPESDE